MHNIAKPMLAVAVKDISQIKFPVLATPKLDGIRCLIINGQPVSRKFKTIPNKYISHLLGFLSNGLDGEIIAGDTFNECQSKVMSEDGTPDDFKYVIFDYVSKGLEEEYSSRMEALEKWYKEEGSWHSFVEILLPKQINNIAELDAYEAECLEQGYEGVMLRSPDGPYKCNRSTLKEGYLLKLKRFEDSEAKIIGIEELMHNNNPLERDELGHAKRSSHKANLIPSGTMGLITVRDIKTKVEFSIGTGFTAKDREDFWKNRDKYIGKIITYTYQPSGMKDKPRFPSYKGFRHKDDL